MSVVGLGVYSWQLAVPRFMELYDSSVYTAATLHLVSGVLPYRDFTFVQPPGVLLMLAPLSEALRWAGSSVVLTAARATTLVVASANVGLLAWLVRRHGRLAMAIAGFGLALTPVAVFVSSSVKIEPYCLAFILLGANTWFGWAERDADPTPRRAAAAGVLFGVAASIELWALFPFVALLLVSARDSRRRAGLFVLGAGLGLVAIVSPFAAAAPHAFVNEVFVGQILRHSNVSTGGQGIWWRLSDATGFAGTGLAPSGPVALALIAALWASATSVVRPLRRPATPESFLLLASVTAVAGLLVGPDAFLDFGYFAAPFLVGTLAVVGAAGARAVAAFWSRARVSTAGRRVVRVGLATIGVVLAFGAVANRCQYFRSYSSLHGATTSGYSVVATEVPSGSCAVYTSVSIGLFANRFAPGTGCPSVIDPAGVWQAWGDELRPPSRQLIGEWQRWFWRADYVVTSFDPAAPLRPVASTFHYPAVPWTAELQSWFLRRFKLLATSHGIFVYERLKVKAA